MENIGKALRRKEPVPEAPRAEGGRAILAAAEELFALKGYGAVSLSAIAAKAGVCKANIFHHFRSKRALYLAVLQRARSEVGPHLQQLLARHAGLREELPRFVGWHLSSLLRQERISRLLLREVLESDPHEARELAQAMGRNFALLVEVLRQAQQRRELRADLDAAVAAALLVAANVFFLQSRQVLRHLADGRFADDPDGYASAVADIILNGITPSARA